MAPSAHLSLYCVIGRVGILAGTDNHFVIHVGKDAGVPSIFKLRFNSVPNGLNRLLFRASSTSGRAAGLWHGTTSPARDACIDRQFIV